MIVFLCAKKESETGFDKGMAFFPLQYHLLFIKCHIFSLHIEHTLFTKNIQKFYY